MLQPIPHWSTPESSGTALVSYNSDSLKFQRFDKASKTVDSALNAVQKANNRRTKRAQFSSSYSIKHAADRLHNQTDRFRSRANNSSSHGVSLTPTASKVKLLSLSSVDEAKESEVANDSYLPTKRKNLNQLSSHVFGRMEDLKEDRLVCYMK